MPIYGQFMFMFMFMFINKKCYQEREQVHGSVLIGIK
jgi:hypothetical protein